MAGRFRLGADPGPLQFRSLNLGKWLESCEKTHVGFFWKPKGASSFAVSRAVNGAMVEVSGKITIGAGSFCLGAEVGRLQL